MIPKNPITIGINKSLLDKALKTLNETYLPNFDIVVTSQYRDKRKNKDVGGAEDSSHMYGLAADYVLKNRTTGVMLNDSQMERVFNEFIKPNWPGYTYFSPTQPHTKTGWIHGNLDRDISKYAGWAAAAGIIAGGAFLFTRLKQQFKKK